MIFGRGNHSEQEQSLVYKNGEEIINKELYLSINIAHFVNSCVQNGLNLRSAYMLLDCVKCLVADVMLYLTRVT